MWRLPTGTYSSSLCACASPKCLKRIYFFLFFFSSRRRHTRFSRDWSSDVCSSDLSRDFEGFSAHTDAVFEASLTAMENAGATLADVFFPHFSDIFSGAAEFTVLLFDFVQDLQKYLATRVGVPIADGTLQDAIDFNNNNASREMPFFGQEFFLLARSFSTDPTVTQAFGFSYNDALAHDQLIGATEGIDMLLADNNLDAIVAPTDNPAWPTDLINGDHFVIGSSSPAAIAGYPIINVPSGLSF